MEIFTLMDRADNGNLGGKILVNLHWISSVTYVDIKHYSRHFKKHVLAGYSHASFHQYMYILQNIILGTGMWHKAFRWVFSIV
jgi:hypothetical protein